jgi:two-component system sensor histidine kinase RegB
VNPFSIIYLVGIAVAAVALGQRWALAVALLSSVAYGLTFLHHHPLHFTDASRQSETLPLHLSGMWVVFAAAAILIAYFVGRVSEALERRERDLTEARAAAARSERLAALLSMGAGAAHELATPLSTIRTAAGELERVVRASASPAASEHVALIRGEVDRCASILDQLSGRASSAASGEEEVSVDRLVEDVRHRLGESRARRLHVELPAAPKRIAVPAEPLRQTLVALLRNAFDASSPDQSVTLRVDQDRGTALHIVDQGRGMSAEETARIGEPFFTTKAPGAGLGLGLFLARAFADQIGGSLRVASVPSRGTAVVLEIPGPSS